MKKKTGLIFILSLLFFNADFSFAGDLKFKKFATNNISGAVKRFDACVRGEQAGFDADHQICGGVAENTAELHGYLVCPRLKRYIFSKRLEVDAKRGRFRYSCNGRPDVG